jgi:hypothetical protein
MIPPRTADNASRAVILQPRAGAGDAREKYRYILQYDNFVEVDVEVLPNNPAEEPIIIVAIKLGPVLPDRARPE